MPIRSWIIQRIPRSWNYRVSRAYRFLWRRYAAVRARWSGQGWPPGHYYSPLVDIADVRARARTLFCRDVDVAASIDLRVDEQRALMAEMAELYRDFDWPELPVPDRRYYLNNDFFSYGDAIALFSLMRHLRPKRLIEVGSGFSSALMLDTRDRFLDYRPEFTFIEPFSTRLRMLLGPGDQEDIRLIEDRVQNVPVSVFQKLDVNDILFVDTSHVSKVGSDVNFILFEVLPALKPGVIVHFHDVYWPFEYPERWIVEFRWSWNEAYLLRAFLQYNERFQILFFNSFAGYKFSEWIEKRMPLFMKHPGLSLWLRKS